MKRDMDLIRKILLAIEAHPKPDNWGVPIDLAIKGYSPEGISYHIKLLAQAGLVEAKDASTMGKYQWRASSLTWAGHEFLEASRDDTLWEKAKKLVLEKTGTLTFEGLKLALMEVIRRSLS